MKPVFLLLGILGSIGLTSAAFASVKTEVVELNVDFEISKCIYAGTSGVNPCDAAASEWGNISIPLSDCTTAQGTATCQGMWEATRTLDGYPFSALITASKTTYGANEAFYLISASVGLVLNSSEPIGIQIYLNGGVLTDSVSINGSPLVLQEGSLSYRPSLLISPKMPIPPISKK